MTKYDKVALTTLLIALICFTTVAFIKGGLTGGVAAVGAMALLVFFVAIRMEDV